MARAARLLDLVALLQSRRHAVTGTQLASVLSISRRTLYRDIQTLKALGATIEGEAGVGYLLKPGFVLPPLMFTAEQLEAVALGASMVAHSADEPLALAARDALAKIAAVLPEDRRNAIEEIGLLSGPRPPARPDGVPLAKLRAAIRSEYRIVIYYADALDRYTTRQIWPIELTFGVQVRLLAAWCELREDFRSFRVDRIIALTETASRYPKRRRSVLRRWRQSRGVSPGIL